MKLLVVLLACACGARPRTPPIKHRRRRIARSRRRRQITPERLCTRLGELKTQACGIFSGLDMNGCPKLVKDGLDDPSNRPVIEAMGECALELTACGDVIACLGASQSRSYARVTRRATTCSARPSACRTTCGRKAAKRDLVKYSQVKSTKAKPVEVCGIPTENNWLAALTCDDGSRPITDDTAETVRVGSLGEGGRCNSIIDLYRVTCRRVPMTSTWMAMFARSLSLVLLFACSKSADGPTCEQVTDHLLEMMKAPAAHEGMGLGNRKQMLDSCGSAIPSRKRACA